MQPILYAITPENLSEAILFQKVESTLKAGCHWIQYRDKSSDVARRQREARALLTLCHDYNAKLIVNDDLGLALHIGADGLHMGQGDGNHKAARQALPETAIFGITCHDSLTLAEQARADGATYLAFGRFFPSTTKPNAKHAPLSLLQEARTAFPQVPIVAIGGIDAARSKTLLQSGADIIAVSESIFGQEDCFKATQEFLTYF
jgi:thiamine-phosphate pyrophosphorylase